MPLPFSHDIDEATQFQDLMAAYFDAIGFDPGTPPPSQGTRLSRTVRRANKEAALNAKERRTGMGAAVNTAMKRRKVL